MQKQYVIIAIITSFLVIAVAVLVVSMSRFMLAYAVSDPVPKYIPKPASASKTKQPVYVFEEDFSEEYEVRDAMTDETSSAQATDNPINAPFANRAANAQTTRRTVNAQAIIASDAELLARLLYAECRGEPRAGQLMVAQCVLDRVANGTWGRSISSVIYSFGQFAKPGKLTDELLAVAHSALAGERFREDCVILYFRRTNSTGDWFAPYLSHVGVHGYYGYLK